MSYAYLGPAGTFTESALLQVPGAADAQRIPASSVNVALSMVREGSVEAAMVPIENSVEGGVSATLDAIAQGEACRSSPKSSFRSLSCLPCALASIRWSRSSGSPPTGMPGRSAASGLKPTSRKWPSPRPHPRPPAPWRSKRPNRRMMRRSSSPLVAQERGRRCWHAGSKTTRERSPASSWSPAPERSRHRPRWINPR